jgi:hypothetical protein
MSGDRAPSSWRDVLIVFAVSLIVAVPLVAVRFPIGQDLPAHIETAAQILALWRGDADVAAHYVLHSLPWPNALPTMGLAALMTVTDGLDAARLLTGLGLVLWPTSLALLCRPLGRSPLWALVALPTTYDLAFAYGFFHFVVGKPLWALVLAHAVDTARSSDVRKVGALALLLPVLFCTHLLLGLSAIALSIVVVVVIGNSWPRRAAGVMACVVGAVPALWWMHGQPTAPQDSLIALPLAEAANQLWANLGDIAPDDSDRGPWLLAAVVVAIAIVGTLVQRGVRAGWIARETLVLLSLGLLTLGFALLGPIRTHQASVVAERFSSLGVALLVLAVPITINHTRRWQRATVVAAGIIIAVVMAWGTTSRWRAFNTDDMGDFDALLQRIPPGTATATHFVRPLSVNGRFNVLWHWPKLVSLRGGVTDDSFAWRATCVVGLRDSATPPRRRAMRANEPFSSKGLKGFDQLVVQGHDPRVDAAIRRGLLTTVLSTGVWHLLHINHPERP